MQGRFVLSGSCNHRITECHRDGLGDGAERAHRLIALGDSNVVIRISGFFKDGQEVVQLLGWNHVERTSNSPLEFTSGLVDLLHESMLAEEAYEILVAIENHLDVLVALAVPTESL